MIDLPSLEVQQQQIAAFDAGLTPATLLSASSGLWQQPSGADVRIVLSMANLSGSDAGALVNVNSRTIRKWTGDDQKIPFAAWALLVDRAGLGQIWLKG